MGIDQILIVDDDYAFVNRLKNGLQQFGQFTILTAPDGSHALRLLAQQKISLVITDLDMPKLDGLELLAAMTREFPNVLSIVSTALQKGILLKRSPGDSLFSYLNKPYDHVRLHNEIIKVLDCPDEIHFKPGIYLSSLLPLFYVDNKTCLLEVQSGGSKKGTLYFRNGGLCDALQGELTGLAALEEMFRWDPGKYWIKELPLSHAEKKTDRVLTGFILEGTGIEPPTMEEVKTTDGEPRPYSQSLPTAPVPPVPGEAAATLPGDSPSCGVLIADDSAEMRQALKKILLTDRTLEIEGEAATCKQALELAKMKRPDVVILDVKMDGMEGMTMLKHMMIQAPVPVIVFSDTAHEGAAVTFESLRYGAVDFLVKPPDNRSSDLIGRADEIIRKIHQAAKMKITSARYIRSVAVDKKSAAGPSPVCKRVVCLGAAEGGYAALLKVIPGISGNIPAACFVVLHAIPRHVDAFAGYLDRHSSMRVQRVGNELPVAGGTCYFASGKEYVSLENDSTGKLIMRVNTAPSWSMGNAIDMFMFSMAERFKEKSIGVLLSGAGNDGTEGLQEIKRAGGTVLIQNPNCCLYKEMVENAKQLAGKNCILPETKIAETINKICLNDPRSASDGEK